MQLPYFYQQNILSNITDMILSEETSKHCIQVLRMKPGDELQLTNGKGKLITATVINADKKNCRVKIEETYNQQPITRNISIAISLLKNTSRFEWFLEKATEIGVSEIIPLLCHRTERQHFRLERMNAILISAMLQSRQIWLPVLQTPLAFEKAVAGSSYQKKIIAHCAEDEKKTINELNSGNEVQIFIGPEGDFTETEIECALQNNFYPVSLGNTRLRTETAGIVAAALLINSSS